MNKSSLSFLVLAALIFVMASVSGCGSSSSEGGGSAETTAEKKEYALNGTYTSECKYMSKLVLKNEGTVSELVVYSYLDALCKDLKATGRYYRTAEVGPALKENANAYEVDITYDKVELTMEIEVDPEFEEYGMKGWKKGETRDITGLTNTLGVTMPAKGQTYYQSWTYDQTFFKMEYPGYRLKDLPDFKDEGHDKEHRSDAVLNQIFTKA